MRQGLSQSQRLDVSIGVDPRLIVSSQILQMSNLELDAALETELAENPALERHDAPEGASEDEIMRIVAPQEFRPTGDSWEPKRSLSSDGDPTWTDLVPAMNTLEEHLIADLLPRLPRELWNLGEIVIGCLDERGYLAAPPEEIAMDFESKFEDVERVIVELHRCNPPGIGARDIRECLLLQLRGLDTVVAKLARAVVRRHLDDFSSRRVSRISRRYRVVPDLVEESFELIAGLAPFPAEGFSTSTAPRERQQSVLPDILFKRSEQGWEIEVAGLDPSSVCISRTYADRLDALKSAGRRDDREEQRHLTTYVQRAENFIDSIRMRRQTLIQVGRYLVNHQGSFLHTGDYAFLKPLTRAKLATDLGVHESTISRATNNKFVQLSTGEVVPFEVFFKPALRIHKMIAEILQTENPGNPLSDERIAQLLAEKGVVIARRTVSKYRDRTKSLSSRKRRVA